MSCPSHRTHYPVPPTAPPPTPPCPFPFPVFMLLLHHPLPVIIAVVAAVMANTHDTMCLCKRRLQQQQQQQQQLTRPKTCHTIVWIVRYIGPIYVTTYKHMYICRGITIDFHFCAFYNKLCCILFALSLTAVATWWELFLHHPQPTICHPIL